MLVEEQGFEPWAFRMQSGRSATELHPLLYTGRGKTRRLDEPEAAVVPAAGRARDALARAVADLAARRRPARAAARRAAARRRPRAVPRWAAVEARGRAGARGHGAQQKQCFGDLAETGFFYRRRARAGAGKAPRCNFGSQWTNVARRYVGAHRCDAAALPIDSAELRVFERFWSGKIHVATTEASRDPSVCLCRFVGCKTIDLAL